MMRSQDSKHSSKMIAYIAVMTALASVFGYIEQLIPISFFGIPGVKLGIANIVSLIALYMFGTVYAYLILLVRIIIIGFMFGNMYAVFFSLTGGLLSMSAMYLLKRSGLFTLSGISAAGGAVHNLGQLIVAALTLNELDLSFYIPLLMISGTAAGTLMGILAQLILNRINGKITMAE